MALVHSVPAITVLYTRGQDASQANYYTGNLSEHEASRDKDGYWFVFYQAHLCCNILIAQLQRLVSELLWH